MKKFRYRLQRILDFREVVKTERLRELMAAQRAFGDAVARLSELEAAQISNGLPPEGGVPAHLIDLVAAYGHRLRREIVEQRALVAERAREAEAALAAYVEAARDAEALIKHRANKSEEHRELAEKADQKFIDELTIQRSGGGREF